MLSKILILMFLLIGISVGYSYGNEFWDLLNVSLGWLTSPPASAIIFGLLFMLIGILITPAIIRGVKRLIETLEKQETSNLLMGTLGIVVGLVIGILVAIPFVNLKIPVISNVVPFITSFILAIIGYYLMTNRMEDLKEIFVKKPSKSNQALEGEMLDASFSVNFYKYKLLDTSVIIDGRIVDIIKAGFIEGVLVIPNFVLEELQGIADSSDSLTRAKGRRGLDILNELQNDNLIPIEFYEGDFDDVQEVDSKLVRLAKLIDGAIITNDYNLNKVCQFQNIKVFNINELANSVKPILIPGETLKVKILKEGSERKQGVAYLDDGTMIVVEDGQYYMREFVSVVVTSSIQTSAGRMVFAKPVHSSSRLEN